MKLNYTLLIVFLVLLMSFDVSAQKSQETIISVIRQDSIKNVLKKFGLSADLFFDEFQFQRFERDLLPNEEGTQMFLGLFAHPNEPCIFNYLDTTRIPGNAAIRGEDSLALNQLRFFPELSPAEYVKLLNFLYTYEGSSSELDTTRITVIDQSERKSFGRKYRIDVLANFSFTGQNDSLESRTWLNAASYWFSLSYEKYNIKDQVIFKNFKIIKVRPRPVSVSPWDTIPPIEPKLVFSVEPFVNSGVNSGGHTFKETFENHLTGHTGWSADFGVTLVKSFKLSEDTEKFADIGLGVGYSILTYPLTLQEYEIKHPGLTPPFQPSSYFKEYNYFISPEKIDENHTLGFVSIPVFSRLRFPLKNNREAFVKLTVSTMIPGHTGYRAEGNIHYTGEFHYVFNNKETIITTDKTDANLSGSIPDFNSLYGDKASRSWEKIQKTLGVTSRLESGLSFKSGEKVKYFAGAYVSYRIAGMNYGNDADLAGQEGRINSFLLKTDKINPWGCGITVSASFDIYKDRIKQNK